MPTRDADEDVTRVPNVDQAQVSDRKLSEYLLAAGHPIGGAKARFFLALGFAADQAERLRNALLQQASSNPVAASERTAFGVKYLVDGPLATPRGGSVAVRSVWFIASGEALPQFVTAYPMKGASK
ncbi:MAG: DUF6883 domain-containing protein [Vicinamibacterales bacterium]